MVVQAAGRDFVTVSHDAAVTIIWRPQLGLDHMVEIPIMVAEFRSS
jgi:hypothetical protein